MSLHIRQVRLDDPLVAPLLAGLTDEYQRRYGANSEMALTAVEQFDPPSGIFFVLVDGDTTAAGGGYRAHDENACEVKRMWTSPDYRRRGLASRVLAALEEAASEAGYRRLILETGPRQPEAFAMYETRGYRRVPTFGPYDEGLAFELQLS